jgi:hypothetical protein
MNLSWASGFKQSGKNKTYYIDCSHSLKDKSVNKVKVRFAAEKFRPHCEAVEFVVEITCSNCKQKLKTAREVFFSFF